MRNFAALWMTSLLCVFIATTGCDDDDDYYDRACVGLPASELPRECDGRVGSACDSDRDCDDRCCREKHCGREGMCTLSCKGDRDCPADMLCEHDVCLFACDSYRDCAPGWKCGHDNRVCEAE